MKLEFKSTYLSISEFNSIDLPDFTILTGVNGSGKSHILEAIEKGNSAIAGIGQANIVRFNYETFKLENEGAFNAQQLFSERESAWTYHDQQIRNQARTWRKQIEAEYEPLKEECKKHQSSMWKLTKDSLMGYRDSIRSYFSSPKLAKNDQARNIFALIKTLPYGVDELDHDEFIRLYKPYAYKNNFLPNQIGKIFWDYYVKYRGNQVNEFQNERYGKQYPALSEEQFLLTHGEKPWIVLNKILGKFNTLDYRINSPEGLDYFGNFQLRLEHTKTSALEIEFSHLSSGEKVLMALVASVYKSSSDQNFPDLLLLDEVDASLHPSMMQNMLDSIREIFIDHGVKVILVTHSPTTIALAPDESVYVMNKYGKNRIEKRSKQEALSILTEGFATLEEGIRIFDEVARKGISIISEGNNTNIIKKACELFGYSDIEIITGVESTSGKSQLKTLYDFFSRTTHKNKVVFAWDCDANYQLPVMNNTYPYIFERNLSNKLASSGIENMFPEELFVNFKKTITLSSGEVITEFDESRKGDFERYVIERNNKEDFQKFTSFFERLNQIKISK